MRVICVEFEYAVRHFTDCHQTENHNAEYRHNECHYPKSFYAECRGAKLSGAM
jgi:hypothetical protein